MSTSYADDGLYNCVKDLSGLQLNVVLTNLVPGLTQQEESWLVDETRF